MKKRILALAMTLCMTITCAATAFAAEEVRQTKILVNNAELENVMADAPEGQIISVPARAVLEALGCTVEWVPNGDPAIIVSDMMGRKVMTFNVGGDVVTRHLIDGSTEDIKLVSPVYLNGWVTMVNAYAIATALDLPIYSLTMGEASVGEDMFHYDDYSNVYFPVFMPPV